MLKASYFYTKAYTIERLISEVSSLTLGQTSSVTVLANSLSPRAGLKSAKVAFLNTYVGGNLNSVISGKGGFGSYGKTPRTRILTALRRRQKLNF